MKQSLLFRPRILLSNTISSVRKYRKTTVIVLFLLTYQLSYGGDIIGKLIVGYQGWFTCKGDGSPRNSWVHWGGNPPAPGNLHFDLYPDMREYTTTYQTGFANLGNGQPATLFSSYDTQVVNKHVEWMQQYGIDVVALQRFSSGVKPGTAHKAHKDGIALKIKNACETYGRKFYMMYDLSDMAMDTAFIDILRKDWSNTLANPSALNLLASPAYAKEMVNGELKPVVCIWGIGSSGRPGDQASWTTVINWFKQQGLYVIVGAEKNWRDTPAVRAACENAHMISPWHVGTFGLTSVGSWATKIKNDMIHCKNLGIAYMPVLWPGFSWRNWKPGYEDKPNHHPRMHGDFMWNQFYQAKVKFTEAGMTATTYVAMFDEYDEGTAIAKAAENASMIPTNQWFLTLDYDGVACSSDFYLRLVGDAAKMIKGIIPLTSTHPTNHTLPPSANNNIHETRKSVKMYPNPLSKNILTIELVDFQNLNNVQINIANLLGQTVYQKRIQNTKQLDINTSDVLNKSIYLVSVESGKDKATGKLIVE